MTELVFDTLRLSWYDVNHFEPLAPISDITTTSMIEGRQRARHRVLEALQALLAADPDVVDRRELGELVAHARVVRGFVDVCDLRNARRGQELAEAGESESPLAVLTDEGRRSGKEAKAAQARDRVCGDFVGFEDALAAGDVSGDHLDVLARLTRHITDEVAADLRAEANELLTSASNEYVSQFERSTKERIAHIRSQHAPEHESAELDRQRAESNMKRWTDQASGMKMTLLALDPLRDAAFHSAVDAQLARLRQDPANAKAPFAQLRSMPSSPQCRPKRPAGGFPNWSSTSITRRRAMAATPTHCASCPTAHPFPSPRRSGCAARRSSAPS